LNVNRWGFLTALVVVGGAVAAFAIYTFGWRDDEGSSAERARAYAATLAASCDPHSCRVVRVSHISGNDWKVVLRVPATGRIVCAIIQTNRFAERASGDFAGAARMRCPEARPGQAQASGPAPAPVGPAWWDETQAEDNIEHSKWVFDNGINGGVFSCVGQGPIRQGLFRRFACTYESAGPQLDKSGRLVIVTTGSDTFRVVSS
jgi:hypothetical protein